ncbi:GTPase-activating protein [Elysia marginata]|uniref:GTPase-activating protein n=1 Tax=Elysia marginata TaxID=1093978 RepID=A0AAV4IDN2_9GAST|nr:GTPase-activating protein [Elysia marginata]
MIQMMMNATTKNMVSICSEDASGCKHSTDSVEDSGIFYVTVRGSAPKPWLIRRTVENFLTLDKQLHKCIFDRRFSHLEDLSVAELGDKPKQFVADKVIAKLCLSPSEPLLLAIPLSLFLFHCALRGGLAR